MTIKFSAREQRLMSNDPYFASGTIGYIKAVFDLDEQWKSFDVVTAIWTNQHETISTVLDEEYSCVVPHEVLAKRGRVYVNLAAVSIEDDTVKARLTTYPYLAIQVDAKALLTGSETTEITPSQFDQYVGIVTSYLEAIQAMVAHLPTSAEEDGVYVIEQTDGDMSLTPLVLPTDVSDLTNDAGYITISDVPEIPTNVSDFTNDAGYITLADLPLYDGSVE